MTANDAALQGIYFRRPTPHELWNMHPERPLEWYDYADAWLPQDLGRFLDYGCGQGHFVRRVASRCAEAWGCDLNPEILPADSESRRFIAIRSDQPLPFPDNYFDSIAILEVIEHVADERTTLKELTRILKPGGRLLLTTPHKGILTWMDPGNFKVLFPRLHKFTHRKVLSNEGYFENRFGEERKLRRGMYADFSADHIPWHRHYRHTEIMEMADPHLEVVGWSVYYIGMRMCWCAQIANRVLSRGRNSAVPWPFKTWSYRSSRRESKIGDQLVMLFRKKF